MNALAARKQIVVQLLDAVETLVTEDAIPREEFPIVTVGSAFELLALVTGDLAPPADPFGDFGWVALASPVLAARALSIKVAYDVALSVCLS